MTFYTSTINRKNSVNSFFLVVMTWVSLMVSIPALATTDNQPTIGFNIAWDNHYISEGRNNLDKGGIVWGVASFEQEDLAVYAVVGRADQVHYIEWNAGLEYTLHLHDDVDATIGYQRLEFYGDERASDNEFFSSLTYNGFSWLIPAINYTFATEAGGYFVELSLHSPWEINEQLTLTPYVVQGVDFQYSSEQHDGANHFQFGLEAEHQISDSMSLSAHISHSIAQEDIKQQASTDGIQGSLDQTYAGVYLNLTF
ncbi:MULTISPECIES: hypothetical protein [Shewanella]|uniref:hypothetical protein n=1 Tax=Shewanella TaxID=22 RepID=UPI00197FDDE9|nr:hypothetical protein [Shewanella polaris]